MQGVSHFFSDDSAVLKKVVLSQNKLFGQETSYPYGHTVDANQTGWSALCDALPSSPLEELIAADIGMGVTGVTSLAKAISAGAALASLTCDSTGDMDSTKTYTLVAENTSLDLSSKKLGPADATLLASWIATPMSAATLVSLNISGKSQPS